MVQSPNGPGPRLDRLAGLHRLRNDPAILVDHPSLCKLLAFAPFTLSRAASGLGCNVDHRWANYRFVTRGRALLEPAGLGASHLPLRRRVVALFAIGEALQREATRRIP